MQLRIYGHGGKPCLVFPSQGGSVNEFEDFGMVRGARPWIDAGKLRVVTVESADQQSWTNEGVHPGQRAWRHNDYDRYVTTEVLPLLRQIAPKHPRVMATGCSMGAYHAANFFFRHPDLFDTVVAMSGVYRLNLFIGDYMDETVYFNTPLAYLANLTDNHYLDLYRRSDIIVAVGQGRWEVPCLEETRELGRILHDKRVPAWIDVWGHDVDHDWPWWRKMWPHFLSHLPL